MQVPAPGTTTAGVAGAFATATYPSGYTAFVIGSTVYITRASAFTLSSTPVGRHATGNGTFSGTVPLIWTQTAVFSPAGTPAIQLGDLWSITVGMTTYTARVTDIGTSSGNYGFGLTGGTATSYTVANTTAASTALAGALATAIGAQASLAGGTTLTLTGTGGSPLGVGPLTEQRVGALPTASTADTNTHYENVTATLSGDVTPVWQPTETWTLTIDGHAYTFLVPGTGFTTAQQTLTTIAAQLVLAYNTSSTKDTNLQVTSSGGEILIKDNTTGGTDPFSFSITRGSSAVTGVIDIDNANDIASSVLVPVVLPEFQWLVALFPWAKQYFEVADSLGFTAQPEFQLWGPGSGGPNTLLATVTCTLIPNTNTCSLTPDAGSAQASDPFLEYNFTQTGTYTVKVGANVTWNGATTFLDVPNTFFSSGFQGVQTGMKYTLFISLEHHATNPNALSLVGKQITITAGAGAGQTATITAYDPQNGTYTLDQQWATAPDAGSRFQITESTASLPGYAPVTDSYKVVLTSPVPAGQTVYVDVSPQPTPTYNADQAFDPNSNYGQNNAVQVRVQTPRALFLLTGVPTPGETWTILLNDQPFSYRIQLGDTLASIAHQLTLMIGGVGTGYTASVDPSNADQVIVQSSTGASFYAGFQITHEAEGGATVTPSPSAGAALTFSGIPAPGEIWRLTLDGVVYSTLPATSSDTLATIMQALAVQLPAHGYTFTISGNVLNVARAAGTGQITASLAVTAPTVGNISLNYSFFNEADLLFGGTPVAGERWSVFVDGNQISTVSTAGESIAQVISSLAGQIPFVYPYDYSYSAGLSDLFVEHGFWLFFGYSSISLFGTVTLNPSQVYGTLAVANTAPTGVNIVLNAPSGGPAAGETWTLTLDGTKYAYAYNGGGGSGALGVIAQALANLIPQSPATAHGGPYYSVGVSGSSLVVRRSDQAVPVTASVSVSLPATASTVPNTSNPAQTTVTYTGSPLQGEVWAITVDGTTYSYVSNTGDLLSTVIGALKSAIPSAGYTVGLTGNATSQSLTITSKTVGATLDAFGSVVLDTSETQGTGTATASGQNVTIALPAIQVGAGETWALTVDGTPFAYTTTATDTPATIAAQLGILVHAVGTYNVIVNGTTLTLSRVDGNTTSASLAISTLGAAGGGAMGSSVAVDFEGQPTQGEVWTLSITTTSGTETHSFAVLYGDTLSDIASGLGKALSLDTYNVSVVGRVPHHLAAARRPAVGRDRDLARQPRRRRDHAAARVHQRQLERGAVRDGAGARQPVRRRPRRARLPADDRHAQPGARPGDHRRRAQRQPRAVPEQPADAAGRDEPAARRRHDRGLGREPRGRAHRRRPRVHLRSERDERDRDDRPAPRLRPAHERLRLHRRVPERHRVAGDAGRLRHLARHPLRREHHAVHVRPHRRRLPLHRHARPVDDRGQPAHVVADLRRRDRPVELRDADAGRLRQRRRHVDAGAERDVVHVHRRRGPDVADRHRLEARGAGRSAPASSPPPAARRSCSRRPTARRSASASSSSRPPARPCTAPRASPARPRRRRRSR